MNMYKIFAQYRLPLLLTAVAIPTLTLAQSDTQASNEEDSTTTTKTAPVTTGGRKAYIDPDTGELTSQPPADDKIIEPGERVFQQSSEGLVEEVRPDGSASVNLQGRFRMPLMIRKNCDGTLTTWHGDESQLDEEQNCGE